MVHYVYCRNSINFANLQRERRADFLYEVIIEIALLDSFCHLVGRNFHIYRTCQHCPDKLSQDREIQTHAQFMPKQPLCEQPTYRLSRHQLSGIRYELWVYILYADRFIGSWYTLTYSTATIAIIIITISAGLLYC